MTVMERLSKLQEEFFKLSGAIYKNIELLGDLYPLMQKDVEELYKQEGKRFMREAQIDYDTAKYELDVKENILLPGRRGLFWCRRNESADIIYREVMAQAYELFDKRTKALEKLEEALKQSSKNGRPDEEPEEPQNNEQKSPQDGNEPKPRETAKPGEKSPENAERHVQDDEPDGATTNH